MKKTIAAVVVLWMLISSVIFCLITQVDYSALIVEAGKEIKEISAEIDAHEIKD